MDLINIEVKYPYKGSVKDRILDSFKLAFGLLILFIAALILSVNYLPVGMGDDAYDVTQSRPLSFIFGLASIILFLSIFIAPFFKRENKGIKSFKMIINPENLESLDLRITKKNGKTSEETFMIDKINIEKRYYRFVGFKKQYVIPKKVLSSELEQKLCAYIEAFNKSGGPIVVNPKEEKESKKDETGNDKK